jgi:RHS repeat-associated protein
LGNTATKLEEHHYYPYGLKHEKYNSDQYVFVPITGTQGYEVGINPLPATERTVYQYKYNGKEWQDELGLNVTAMDFRQYDNALGRFHGMDRLAEQMSSITPYHFGFNNPNYWADPSGLKSASAIEMLQSAWDATPNGTNSYWVNDGAGNFDYSGDGFGGWDSGLLGSWISNSGTFNGGGGGGINFVALPELIMSGNSSTWVGHIQQHVYSNSVYYSHLNFGNRGGGGINWSGINTGVGAFGFGLGAKTELIDFASKGSELSKGTANYLKFSKGLGKIVGGVGIGVTIWEINSGKKNLIGEGGLDLIMGGIGLTGWGTPISLIYFGGKLILEESGNDFWNK